MDEKLILMNEDYHESRIILPQESLGEKRIRAFFRRDRTCRLADGGRLGGIVAYDLALVAVGVGGVLLLRDLYKPTQQSGT